MRPVQSRRGAEHGAWDPGAHRLGPSRSPPTPAATGPAMVRGHYGDGLLDGYQGRVYRPSPGVRRNGGNTLLCPHPGSLESVRARYERYRRRFVIESKDKAVKVTFQRPPRPSLRPVLYGSPPSRYVYELRTSSAEAAFAPWPLSAASRLIVCLRDAAVERLTAALPTRRRDIERVLVGRRPDGANAGPTEERVRIVPLPSIGHPHADREVRRVIVEVPPACPLGTDDVRWAFSGLEPVDMGTGEVHAVILTPTTDESMLMHYGIGGKVDPALAWRTVTPAALPWLPVAGRAHTRHAPSGGIERREQLESAAGAVIQALRHVDVRARVNRIRVQREPFEGNGERAGAFAPGTRFPRERLWHVQITFDDPVSGPLIIGNGRFLGLGVMRSLASDRSTLCGSQDGIW